jgi:CCR4-NOT transcription complex subunit 7/8
LDEHAPGAITFLEEAGLHFETMKNEGIDPRVFAEYIIASGLVLNEDIKWISFHGGFDFAYLVKLLIGRDMPATVKGFYNILNTYFPNFVDLKYVIKDLEGLKYGGLSRLASEL